MHITLLQCKVLLIDFKGLQTVITDTGTKHYRNEKNSSSIFRDSLYVNIYKHKKKISIKMHVINKFLKLNES